jgi:D-glycero-beta-D-manno-heptose 1-phosphate adenylyltransferase
VWQVNFREKVIPWERLKEWRQGLRGRGVKLVATNGCFDLLHLGHVTYLEAARTNGDALLVGVNSDQAVRELKGADRPVTPEHDRALVLAALASVDAVCVFPGRTAEAFLSMAQPDVYVKGGDYTLDKLNQDERRIVEQAGGKVLVAPHVRGKSTTAVLEKIARL